jgi:hypothetical protein
MSGSKLPENRNELIGRDISIQVHVVHVYVY